MLKHIYILVVQLLLSVNCQITYFTIWLNRHEGLVPHYEKINQQAKMFEGGETMIVDQGMKEWCLSQTPPLENVNYVLDTEVFSRAKQLNPKHLITLNNIEMHYNDLKATRVALAADILKLVALVTLPGQRLVYHDADVYFQRHIDTSQLDVGYPLKFPIIGSNTDGDVGFYSKRKVMAGVDKRVDGNLQFNNDLIFLRRGEGGEENVFTILRSQHEFFDADKLNLFVDDDYGLHTSLDVFNSPDSKEFLLTADQWRFYCAHMQYNSVVRWRTEKGPVRMTAESIKRNYVMSSSLWQVAKSHLQQSFYKFYIPYPKDEYSDYSYGDRKIILNGLVLHGETKGILKFYENCLLDPYTVGAVSRQNTRLWHVQSVVGDERQALNVPIIDLTFVPSGAAAHDDGATGFSHLSLCSRRGTRKKRNVCLFNDVAEYRVINKHHAIVIFANQFLATIEKLKNKAVVTITKIVVLSPTVVEHHSLKVPATQRVLNFFNTAEQVAMTYAIAALSNLRQTESNLLNHAWRKSFELLKHPKLKALRNSIDNVATEVTRKLPRHIQSKAKGWFTFVYVYNILDNTAALIPGQSNALEFTFLTTDLIESTGTLVALKLAKYDRTLFLSSFINRFTNNFIIRGIGNVASIYFLAHRIQVIHSNTYTASDVYFTARSVQHVVSIFSKTVGRVAPWLLFIDIATILRDQLLSTSAELHNKLRILNLSQRDISQYMAYTFFNIRNDYDRLTLYKIGADSLIQELASKLTSEITSIVQYPHVIREDWDTHWKLHINGQVSSSCVKMAQPSQLSLAFNAAQSTSYNPHLENIHIQPMPTHRIFLGSLSTVKACVAGATSDCAITEGRASYSEKFGRLGEIRYGALERESRVCILQDGSYPSGTACQRAQQLRDDEQQRYVYTAIADSAMHEDSRLFPTFRELNNNFWLSAIPKAKLEPVNTVSCITVPQSANTLSSCQDGLIASKCTKYYGLVRYDNQLVNPYIVSRAGNKSVLYLNTAHQGTYSSLYAMQSYPAIIIVPDNQQLITGSAHRENCFIVSNLGTYGILRGGSSNNDILHLLPTVTNAIVDFSLNNILFSNNNMLYIHSIEAFNAPNIKNSQIFLTPNVTYINIGENNIINTGENILFTFIEAANNLTLYANYNSTIIVNLTSATLNMTYGANVVVQALDTYVSHIRPINLDDQIEITFANNKTIVSNNTFTINTIDECSIVIERITNIQQILNTNMFWVTHLTCLNLPSFNYSESIFDTINITTHNLTLYKPLFNEFILNTTRATNITLTHSSNSFTLMLLPTVPSPYVAYINSNIANTTIFVKFIDQYGDYTYSRPINVTNNIIEFSGLTLVLGENISNHYYWFNKYAYYTIDGKLSRPHQMLYVNTGNYLIPGGLYRVPHTNNRNITVEWISPSQINVISSNNASYNVHFVPSLALPAFLITNYTNEQPFEPTPNKTDYTAFFIKKI